jgi:hypothetical protein
MGKFLDLYDLSELNHDDINHLNRFIMSNEIEAVEESPNKEKPNAG